MGLIYPAELCVTPAQWKAPRHPSSFLLPAAPYCTSRHFLRLLSSASPQHDLVPRGYSGCKSRADGENWISHGRTYNYSPAGLTSHDRRHDFTLLLVLIRRCTYGTAGNSSNFSYVNFMQKFPYRNIGFGRRLHRLYALVFFLSFSGQSESRQPGQLNRDGNIRNIGRVFFAGVTSSETLPRGDRRIYIIRGTLSGSQLCLWSAFKNNEDHFLCSFFLTSLSRRAFLYCLIYCSTLHR
jgi:hypothetical protein